MTKIHGYRLLAEFVLECAGGTVVLMHAECNRIVDEWPGVAPTALSDIIASANDHECRD